MRRLAREGPLPVSCRCKWLGKGCGGPGLGVQGESEQPSSWAKATPLEECCASCWAGRVNGGGGR